MKLRLFALTLTVSIFVFCLQSNTFAQKTGKAVLKTQMDSVSYIIGTLNGENLKQNMIQIDPELMLLGVQDAMQGKEWLISKEQGQKVMENFQKMQQIKKQQADVMIAEKNMEIGRKFLAENKTKKDIKVTASGLQYRIIKPGTGESPKLTDKVRVHYRGTLLDGTKFDASYDRGEPATFPLNGVIKGWQEGLQLMKVGGIYQFYIPSELAYGNRAAGQIIQPGSTLVFEVELIAINPAD